MNEALYDALCDASLHAIEASEEMDVGSDSYRSTMDCVTKLVDRVIELEKIEVDVEDKATARAIEAEQRQKQLIIDRNLRYIGYGVTIGCAILREAMTGYGLCRTLKFDASDSVMTTTSGRGFVSRAIK